MTKLARQLHAAGRHVERILGEVPPRSLEAERGVLGSIMLDNRVAPAVRKILKPDDFFRELHRRVWILFYNLFARGEPVDTIMVAEECHKDVKLWEHTGAIWFHELIQGVPHAVNAVHYAKIVKDRAVRREGMLRALDEIQRAADLGSDYHASWLSNRQGVLRRNTNGCAPKGRRQNESGRPLSHNGSAGAAG